jgi:hypothetical protein
MRIANATALAGIGCLAVGAMLSMSDLALFDTLYALIIGPILWIVGCAFMVAWAVGRAAPAVTRTSKEKPLPHEQATPPETAAAGSDTKAVA